MYENPPVQSQTAWNFASILSGGEFKSLGRSSHILSAYIGSIVHAARIVLFLAILKHIFVSLKKKEIEIPRKKEKRMNFFIWLSLTKIL